MSLIPAGSLMGRIKKKNLGFLENYSTYTWASYSSVSSGYSEETWTLSTILSHYGLSESEHQYAVPEYVENQYKLKKKKGNL